MNCKDIDNLMSRNAEIGDLLTVIGENTENPEMDEIFVAIQEHLSGIYVLSVYEAIKAHMNRYLYLWANAEKSKEIDKSTCAELLKEIQALKNLFANRWLFGGVPMDEGQRCVYLNASNDEKDDSRRPFIVAVSKKETDETDGDFKDMYAYELRELIAERMQYWLECNQTEWGTPGAYKKEFAVGDEIIRLLKARRNAPEM